MGLVRRHAGARVLVVAAAGGCAVWLEWPALGGRYMLPSVVYAVVGVGFVLTGVLLHAEPGQRPNGRLFMAAGLLWLCNDLGQHRLTGPLPALGWLTRPIDELVLIVVLLRYPAIRIGDRLGRLVARIGMPAVLIPYYAAGLVWRPVTDGWPDTFWWPTVIAGNATAHRLTTVFSATATALPAVVVVLLVRRYTASHGLARRELRPVLFSAGAVAVAYVVTQAVQFVNRTNDPGVSLSISQNLVILTVPVAFAAAAVRRRLDRAAVADLVMNVPQPASVTAVRDALRRALLDPTLTVYVWLPDRRHYTDGAVVVPQPPATDRWRRDLTDVRGEPLAVVLLDPALDRRTDLVDAAVRAAALSLENARLHADLLDQLQQLERSRTRIVEAGLTERRRVERNLHDGAQQRLLALAATIGRAHAVADDPAMRVLLNQARGELRAALKDLRDLARGIHPAVLEQIGLGAAIEAVTESLPLPVRLDIDPERLPATIESAAYFVICEALTNIVKHAGASHATVTLHRASAGVHLTVTDDGTGGAAARPGGGLAGLADRVAALNGHLRLDSPAGAGTRLTVELSCGS